MNLNQITPGVDYAYFPQRGKQEEFRWCRYSNENWHFSRMYVFRVKAIRAYAEREYGKKRDTGYLDVFWLNDEGEFKFDENGNHLIKKVRVRDIATVWDDYEDELDYQTVKRDKLEAEREAQRAQERAEWEERARQREEREQREREERERVRQQEEQRKAQYIRAIELQYGLPEGSVKLTTYGDGLLLDKTMIDERLNGQMGLNGEQETTTQRDHTIS